jgi:hypothetical protein
MFGMMILAAVQAAVPAPAPQQHWRVAPVTAGTWTWRTFPGGSEALFSTTAGVQLTLRCTLASRTVALLRTGALPGAGVVVRTTSLERTLPASAVLGARDPLLDAVAFTRGRWSVEATGTSRLIPPSWPEPARTVEDCRK